MNCWYKTAAIGTGIFAILIFFHRVYKLSILHWKPKWSIVWCVDLTWFINQHAVILQDLNKACFKCIFFSVPCYWIITYHIYLRILSNSMFTHTTQCSSELYNQQNILTYVFCTVHCDIIRQHEPMKWALFKLMF